MTYPPLFARVAISRSSPGLALWFPLVLVWLVLLVLALPFLILLAVALLVGQRRWKLGPLARGTWAAVCETRGTTVEIEGPRSGYRIELR